METLPKDVRFEIAMNLSPPDLINLCLSEKKQNIEVCASKDFWRRKLEKDYPEEFIEFYMKGIPVANPKSIYVNRFTEISRAIEKFIPQFIKINFGPTSKYLNEQYNKDVYSALFKIYTEITSQKISDEYEQSDIIFDHISSLIPEDATPYQEVREFIEELVFNYWDNLEKLNFMKKFTKV